MLKSQTAKDVWGKGAVKNVAKTIARAMFLVTSRLKHSGPGCRDIHHNATLMEKAGAEATVVAGG